MFDVLSGQVKSDASVIADWEIQPVEHINGHETYEYRVDVERGDRFTGLLKVPAGSDPLVLVSRVMTEIAGYF